jgi:hypothetical protein
MVFLKALNEYQGSCLKYVTTSFEFNITHFHSKSDHGYFLLQQMNYYCKVESRLRWQMATE